MKTETKYAPFYVDLFNSNEWNQIRYEDLESYCKAAGYLHLPLRYKTPADPGISTPDVKDVFPDLNENDERIICEILVELAYKDALKILAGDLQSRISFDLKIDQDIEAGYTPSLLIDHMGVTPELKPGISRKYHVWNVQSVEIDDIEETFPNLDEAIISAAKRAYAYKLDLRLQESRYERD